ncbi:MAG: HPr family phosphocarrier protein [Lentisphaeria bacterium]|nr:HPr family phosphocarrier protein [Lentisphaeria bacterium]
MGLREKLSGKAGKADAVCHVVNSMGLHARPACILVQEAAKFSSEIRLAGGAVKEAVDGKSLMSILTLAAGKGTQITITAEGPDAHEAVESLVRLFESGFDED